MLSEVGRQKEKEKKKTICCLATFEKGDVE
jgi:hypothetical protein